MNEGLIEQIAARANYKGEKLSRSERIAIEIAISTAWDNAERFAEYKGEKVSASDVSAGFKRNISGKIVLNVSIGRKNQSWIIGKRGKAEEIG